MLEKLSAPKTHLATLIAVLIAFVGTGPMLSQVPNSETATTTFQLNPLEQLRNSEPQSPATRLYVWEQGIHKFSDTQSQLGQQQLFTLLEALEGVEIGAFADYADREQLRRSLADLENSLTADEFLLFLGELGGLQFWLHDQGLIDTMVLKDLASGCNCNDNDDCDGTCQSVTCISGPDSKAWGVC